jgi:proteasome assembly chaperone (PAC2) family protein
MTNYITVHEKPGAKLEYMISAFGGWPDAAEGATTAVKYLQRKVQARKFAEIDPEEFYDFTQVRPYSSRTRDGRRRVRWPANEFYYQTPDHSSKGMMFFLGVEPNLRWRTFASTIADLAEQCGVKTVIHIGALLDAVPHTRDVRLTGSSTHSGLQRVLDAASVHSSNYQGPTGISTAVMEACTQRGMGYVSLWGHTSHYLQAAPNYRVSYTLAQTLTRLLDLPLDLEELGTAAATFDQEVVEAIAKDEQLTSYVRKLEDRYDESVGANQIPDPADVVRELEQFLKSEQRRGDKEV